VRKEKRLDKIIMKVENDRVSKFTHFVNEDVIMIFTLKDPDCMIANHADVWMVRMPIDLLPDVGIEIEFESGTALDDIIRTAKAAFANLLNDKFSDIEKLMKELVSDGIQ
jgi:DNA-directed RNA polymerase specialized sigma54-like protein